MADKEAKEATGWRGRRKHGRIIEIDTEETSAQSPTHVRMIANVKTAIRAYAHKQWAPLFAPLIKRIVGPRLCN